MRKIIILSFLILAAAIAGILLIRDDWKDTDMAGKPTKVGVLLIGSHADRSFCQTHYEALESLRDELKLELVYRENIPADCYDDVVSLVQDEGCEIVVATSFAFGEAIEKAAAAYPGINFLHATGTGHRNNLATFFGRMYQARYLSGIVAGMQTNTGAIGYVAAFPIPEVVRGINAFALGVRSVRPDAHIYVGYCGSWTEDEPAGKVFHELQEHYPIDVLAVHTDSLQPHREAERQGIWSIGYNLDNADAFPGTYLTACVWKWEVYYRREIMNCLQGKFHGSHVWLELEDGIVALSDFTDHVNAETKAAVQAANARLQSREFDVFYGPITDNTGSLRVGAGESMSDDEMLNGFDWYVEGVTVER